MKKNFQKKIIEGNEIKKAVRSYAPRVHDLIICSPFITSRGMKPLIEVFKKKDIVDLTIISRFDEIEWLSGITDPNVFKELFSLKNKNGNKWKICIFLVSDLHAKAFVFGKSVALVGSANVTGAGFGGNYELASIVRGDAVQTIRKRLEGFIEAGVELTPEALDAKVEYLNGPQCKYFRDFIENTKKLGRDKRPGLLPFTREKDDETFDYTKHLYQFLEHAQLFQPLATTEHLTDWLHEKTGESKANSQRILFVEDLGYIEQIKGGWRITERGKKLIHSKEYRPLFLYKKLRNRWREFQDLEEYLSNQKKPFLPEQVQDAMNKRENSQSEERSRGLLAIPSG